MLWALPALYFEVALAVSMQELSTFVPFVGAVGLIAGFVLLVRWRQRALWWFAVPAIASELLVVISAFAPKQLTGGGAGAIALAFLIAQLVTGAALLWLTRRSWPPAVGFLLFNLTFAAFATFLATMSFTGDWI